MSSRACAHGYESMGARSSTRARERALMGMSSCVCAHEQYMVSMSPAHEPMSTEHELARMRGRRRARSVRPRAPPGRTHWRGPKGLEALDHSPERCWVHALLKPWGRPLEAASLLRERRGQASESRGGRVDESPRPVALSEGRRCGAPTLRAVWRRIVAHRWRDDLVQSQERAQVATGAERPGALP